MKKNYFLPLILSLVMVGTLSLPSLARAQLNLPFGGLVSFFYPCTCSEPVEWVWFTPLYLGPLMITGPMNYSIDSTIPWGFYYNITTPGAYDLGDFSVFGILSCWMTAGPYCFPLPAFGIMTNAGANSN